MYVFLPREGTIQVQCGPNLAKSRDLMVNQPTQFRGATHVPTKSTSLIVETSSKTGRLQIDQIIP